LDEGQRGHTLSQETKETQEITDQLKDIAQQIESNGKTVSSLERQTDSNKVSIEQAKINDSKLKVRKNDLTENIEKLTPYATKEPLPIDEIVLTIQKKRNEQTSLTQQKIECSGQIKELDLRLKKFLGAEGICPIMDAPCKKVSKESNQQYVDDINSEIKVIMKKIAIVDNQKEIVIQQIKEAEILYEEIEEKNVKIKQRKEESISFKKDLQNILSLIESSKEKLELYSNSIENNTKQIEQLQGEKIKLQQRLRVLNAKLNSYEEIPFFDVDKLSTLASSIDQKNNQINKENESINEYNRYLGRYNATLDNIEAAKKEKERLESENNELKNKQIVYEKLSKTFGKNGIQKSIIKSAIPELEKISNRFLHNFNPGKDMFIKFDLDPKTKSGEAKIRGGLDIIIFTNGISRTLKLYSGSESVKIAFSILLALSELLSKRVGKRMQTLIIDERICNLDQKGIYQFADIINEIKVHYKKLIVITHIQQLKDLFEETIKINMTSNGSVIL
jgi:exonuclease SbcC